MSQHSPFLWIRGIPHLPFIDCKRLSLAAVLENRRAGERDVRRQAIECVRRSFAPDDLPEPRR